MPQKDPPRKLNRANGAPIVTYNLYQQLGVDGLRGLSNFNVLGDVSDLLVR